MRSCGMLLPVASLPSPYGIGAFSKEAYDFIDDLVRAGQRYWQILPLGPTSYGDSPYQSFSAFAGNPYFIDLETLTEEGLLTKKECSLADFGSDEGYIAYDKLYENRFPLLRKAFGRWRAKQGEGRTLEKELRPETREYCFYMAVKNYFKGKSWNLWDEDIRLRRPDAVERYEKLLEKGVDAPKLIQDTYYEKSYAQNQILGRALLESIVFMDGKCIASYITKKTMDFYGVKPKDLDGIVSQMRVTKGVEVAIFMYETDASVYKVSLRSKEKVDVSRIAAYFGGGGHAKAAGFSMAGTPHDVLNNLAGQMEAQLLEEEAEEA